MMVKKGFAGRGIGGSGINEDPPTSEEMKCQIEFI